MSKKQKRMLRRILVSAALFVLISLLHLLPDIMLPGPVPFLSSSRVTEGGEAAFFLSVSPPVFLILYLIPYLIIGWDVLWRAVRNIAHGQVFDENFLMALATVGALAIGEYPEAVFVMLFYQVGELFQSYAVDQSRKSITALMDIRPDLSLIHI